MPYLPTDNAHTSANGASPPSKADDDHHHDHAVGSFPPHSQPPWSYLGTHPLSVNDTSGDECVVPSQTHAITAGAVPASSSTTSFSSPTPVTSDFFTTNSSLQNSDTFNQIHSFTSPRPAHIAPFPKSPLPNHSTPARYEDVQSGPSYVDYSDHLLFPTVSSTTPVLNESNAGYASLPGDIWPLPSRGRVPQQPYEQRGKSGKWVPKESIPFVVHGESGISLKDALDGMHTGLEERDVEMFVDCKSSISVRVGWIGYEEWSRQIKTRDGRKRPQPITKAKLATEIAKAVQKFIEDKRDTPFVGAELGWCLRSEHITLDKLYLVRLVNRSRSSWQPSLCFRP